MWKGTYFDLLVQFFPFVILVLMSDSVYFTESRYIHSWYPQMGLQWLWFVQAEDLAHVLSGPIPDTYED